MLHHLLSPADSLSLEQVCDQPSFCVFLARFLQQALDFRVSNGLSATHDNTGDIANNRNGDLSCVERLLKPAAELLRFLEPHFTRISTDILNTNFFPRSGRPEEESEMPDSEPQPEDQHNNSDSHGTTLGETRKLRDACIVHVEFVCMYRSLLCVMSMHQQVQSTLSEGVHEVVSLPASAACDELILKLSAHALHGHSVHYRVAQCTTVSALDLLFSSTAPVAVAALPPLLLRFITPLTEQVETAFTARTPSSKIATVGLCDFVKYATFLQPKVILLVDSVQHFHSCIKQLINVSV